MTILEHIREFLYWLLPSLKGTTSIPGTKLEHPILGMLIFEDEGWWLGSRVVGRYEIEFRVPDDGNGIDEVEAESCGSVFRNFDAVLNRAVARMSLEPRIDSDTLLDRFTPTGLWGFARQNGGPLFYLSFSDAEDEYKLWRVQFENGEPVDVGYDN